MKLVLLIVLALIVTADASFLSRTCRCQAVSDRVNFPFSTWTMASCKMCSCGDPAMTNCEASCSSMVKNYAASGCGIVTKGSKVKYSFDSNCFSGVGTDIYTCA